MVNDGPRPGLNSIDQRASLDLDLESVQTCPMCASKERKLEFVGVQDWVFQCVSGTWDFWRCESCGSLYMSPRPRECEIGKAYATYYTHSETQPRDGLIRSATSRLAVALKWGFVDRQFGTRLPGSIALPGLFYRWLARLDLLPRTFLQDVVWSRPGTMLDIGCGSGKSMQVAKRFGWDVLGVEVDGTAAGVARSKGLDVRHGSYRTVAELGRQFDLIVCNHVIEHVHNPRELLSIALAALGDGGQLWMQWPNPKADGLKRYGVHWRGLEAPRHLTLPSSNAVRSFVESLGTGIFSVRDDSRFWRWAQMSGYEASESVRHSASGRPATRRFHGLRAVIRYLTTRRKILEGEVCVVVITKRYLNER
jgi:SAM-dependent methyltransferase